MKTVLVTGANRGLGLGLCEALSSKGYKVFAGMREVTGFSSPDDSIIPIILDVRDDESIQKAARGIAANGALDVLINNAGLNKDSATDGYKERVTDLESLDREDLLAMFNVNAVSPLMLVKSFLPLMSRKPGFIINISSERASFQNENTSGNYGYRGSKVALNMFTKALLHDLPNNIRTFAIHPGSVRTDMNPAGVLSPQQAAAKIIAVMENWTNDRNGAFLNNEGDLFPL